MKNTAFIFSFLLFSFLSITVPGASAHASAVTIKLDWGDTINNLSAPFQNFSHSLQSVANTPVEKFNFSTSGIAENVSGNAEGLWNRFDAWLFGLIGFHVAEIFSTIFGAVVRILGFIKMAIDWGLSLLHI